MFDTSVAVKGDKNMDQLLKEGGLTAKFKSIDTLFKTAIDNHILRCYKC